MKITILLTILLHCFQSNGQNKPQQSFIDSNLIKLSEQYEGKYASCIIMESQSNKIIYQSTFTRDDKNVITKNNQLSNLQYEDNGLFRLTTLWYLIEKCKIDLSDTINITKNFLNINGRTIKDAHQYIGPITLQESFYNSSNIGLAKFLLKYEKNNGRNYWNQLINNFNINEPINSAGFSTNPFIKNQFNSKDLGLYAMGKGIKTDALHLLMYYNAIANGGKMIYPNTDSVIYTIEPDILKKLQISLISVVTNGTAKNMSETDGSTKFAVKTSTNDTQDVLSMCGYFPINNPRYTMIIIFKPNSSKGYSSSILGSVYKSIGEKLMKD
jgi:cell division protein FtsI (penicillin-binding protein 3)